MLPMTRRSFIAAASASVAAFTLPTSGAQKGAKNMYGLIGKMLATEGQRDKLIDILLEGISGMPGCLSYIVAKDSTDPNAIWITEVWDSQQSHQASLSLPSVQQAIAKGKPIIAGFGERFETIPVGGQDLSSN
ncbi:putative quinol monooxygenase [Neptunicella sp. SCSIO 80796]|uniref:putative quinol monooxygenase n=1 Tax=Neptunicella plasticusilytica TaxID=3117012 RepID=UPI003A4DB454